MRHAQQTDFPSVLGAKGAIAGHLASRRTRTRGWRIEGECVDLIITLTSDRTSRRATLSTCATSSPQGRGAGFVPAFHRQHLESCAQLVAARLVDEPKWSWPKVSTIVSDGVTLHCSVCVVNMEALGVA